MKKALAFLSVFTSVAGFSFEKISVKDAHTALENGSAILIDVREADELQQEGKAKNALFFPKSSIDAQDTAYQEKLASLPKDKTLVFYCRSGKRAGVVADTFSRLGFKTKNMGGFQEWVAAGYPVSPK